VVRAVGTEHGTESDDHALLLAEGQIQCVSLFNIAHLLGALGLLGSSLQLFPSTLLFKADLHHMRRSLVAQSVLTLKTTQTITAHITVWTSNTIICISQHSACACTPADHWWPSPPGPSKRVHWQPQECNKGRGGSPPVPEILQRKSEHDG
jgi:hypothetical protein